jgi:hypothetical protein
MVIKYLCPSCNRYCEIADDALLEEIRCPNCGGEVHQSQAKYVFTPTDAAAERWSKIILAGYLLSVVVPLVGFIFGVFLLFRSQILHGVLCMVASIVSSVLWIVALTNMRLL